MLQSPGHLATERPLIIMKNKNIYIIVGALLLAVFMFQYFTDYKSCMRKFADMDVWTANHECRK